MYYRTGLTAARARQIIDYNPKTGVFRWKYSRNQKVKKNDIAGSIRKDGYRTIKIDYISYKASRLAWLIMTGKWPKNSIDHKNRNTTDDRWSNLREATQTQNNANCKTRSHSKCGLKGVSPHKSKWMARITINGKVTHLGHFATPELAHVAYIKAAKKYFKEFANNGITR